MLIIFVKNAIQKKIFYIWIQNRLISFVKNVIIFFKMYNEI